MLDIKTFNEIILNIINNIRSTSPDVDTKEGTFLRDSIIDPISSEISDLYGTLELMNINQSILTATGEALDRLAANYFIKRKDGSCSTGTVRFYLSNTQIANYEQDFSFPDIYIQSGTILSTYGDASNPALQFKTVESVIIPGNTIRSLSRDNSGYQYRDIQCQSVTIGSDKNIGPNEIISLANTTINGIQFVTNMESFKNGTDAEVDSSLALRIGLAISGNNIGTKNGYLSYILKQPQVIDAMVVGAGDPDMIRDEVTVIDDGVVTVCKPGGCVDIYVRTNTEAQSIANCTIVSENINEDGSVVIDVRNLLTDVPVINIKNVTGTRNINGNIQYVTYAPGDSNNSVKYFASSSGKDKYYIGSTKEVGYIIFDGIMVPKIGETLEITYIYNNGIKLLQDSIEDNKILTADVLIKAAEAIEIILYVNTKCDSSYNLITIENEIKSKINNYINSNATLGSTIDTTDIVYILKDVSGIITMDINSIGFSTDSNKELVQYVRCNANQYIVLKEIRMNNTYIN